MRKIGSVLMALLSVGIILALPSQALAASNSLGVNPRRDYTVKPGETIQDSLNVTNLNKTEALNLTVRPLDFESTNETGAPKLLLKQQEPTRWSLKPYLKIGSSFTVPAGKSVDIPFTITIPSNLGAGSYYSGVHYSVTGNALESNLSLASSSVSLLFVRVSGEARSSLALKNFGAFTPNHDMSSGSYASFYSATKPKYLSFTLENKGNVAEQPTGSIQLKDIFGKQVKLYEDINPNKNIVLLEQTRRIDVCMHEVEVKEKNKLTGQEEEVDKCENMNLAPGRYTASLSLMYGGNGSPTNEILGTASFWYLPAWFLIAVAIGLLLLAFFVRQLVKKVKGIRKPTYGTRRR